MEPERQVRVSKEVPYTKQQATLFPGVGDKESWEEECLRRKVLRLHFEKRYGKRTRFRYKMMSH